MFKNFTLIESKLKKNEKCVSNKIKLSIIYIFIFIFSSCISQRRIAYFQEDFDNDSIGRVIADVYESKIQAGDILSINISSLSSLNTEGSAIFNPTTIKNSIQVPETYLVNTQGMIELPVIGEMIVSGITIFELKNQLKIKLEKYLSEPSVRIRFENFRITILGEVLRPSVYTVPNEHITLPEAIGLAGDLTIYGRRSNVTIVRDENGKRVFSKVDLTSRNLFESPYYYLRTNDVIYVEPSRGKTALTDKFYIVLPSVLSSLSFLAIILTNLK